MDNFVHPFAIGIDRFDFVPSGVGRWTGGGEDGVMQDGLNAALLLRQKKFLPERKLATRRTAMCRINPRVDFAFKKLFGSEGSKDLLVSEKDQVEVKRAAHRE